MNAMRCGVVVAVMAAGGVAIAGTTGAGPVNYVTMGIARDDDFILSLFDVFRVTVSVWVPGVGGVSSVTVDRADVVLRDNGDGEWFGDQHFANLPTMQAAVQGTWTIHITGDSPSTSTFTVVPCPTDINGDSVTNVLDLISLLLCFGQPAAPGCESEDVNGDGTVNVLDLIDLLLHFGETCPVLLDSDFYPTSTIVCPAHDSTVPADVIFSWTDPTGAATPYGLSVDVEDEQGQGDNSFSGTLLITDTSWDPPVDLTPGASKQFSVFYIDVPDPEGLVTSLVTSDAITWGNAPFVPKGYPASTPGFGLGSFTAVGFAAGLPCPENLNCDNVVNVLDLIDLLLCFGQPAAPDCVAEDINEDGTINVLDLIDLLLAFGTACP